MTVRLEQSIWDKDPNPSLTGDLKFRYYPSVTSVMTKVTNDLQARRSNILQTQPDHQFVNLSKNEREILAQEALWEMFELDEIAREPDIWRVSKEVAQQNTLIFVPSKPGLYHYPRKIEKPDRYDKEVFAWGNDRYGLDAAAILGMQFAGAYHGFDYSAFTHERLLGFNEELTKLRPYVRRALSDTPLRYLYMGNAEETKAVGKILTKYERRNGRLHPVSYVPEGIVNFVPPEGINTTIDQTKALKKYLEENSFSQTKKDGFKQVVIVAYAPHAVRIMHMCEQFAAIPNDMKVYVFPLPTPTLGLHDYPRNEATGIVVYNDLGQAAAASHPYRTPLDWQPQTTMH